MMVQLCRLCMTDCADVTHQPIPTGLISLSCLSHIKPRVADDQPKVNRSPSHLASHSLSTLTSRKQLRGICVYINTLLLTGSLRCLIAFQWYLLKTAAVSDLQFLYVVALTMALGNLLFLRKKACNSCCTMEMEV